MQGLRRHHIRAIFTDHWADGSLWDIWLSGDEYTAPELRRPVRIRVCSLTWNDDTGDWRVSETADEIDEEKINNAPRCFHEVLHGLIEDSVQS